MKHIWNAIKSIFVNDALEIISERGKEILAEQQNQREMKQTAVEWLQQALEDTILTHEQIMQTIGLFEQAKDIDAERAYDIYEKWFWDNFRKLSQKEFYNRYFKMKQTAVEWQHIELSKFLHGKSEFIDAHDILIKAKEMEKEQIIDAWVDGDNSDCLSEQDSSYFAEHYYNETFNTEDNG
jgi:hypothetical protein